MSAPIEMEPLWQFSPEWAILTDEEKQALAQHVQVVEYKKNDIIHFDGDEPTRMMVLAQGKVRIYKEGIGQRPQIIRLLKPGDFFGYRALIANDHYNSCASAFDHCVVYEVEKEMFLSLIKSNNHFCYEMLVAIAQDLAISEIQTINLTQKHIRGRLAESILSLLDNYGLDEDGVTIAMYISREDLANMSNMTTSNAIRTLSQFVQEGLLNVDGRKIKLLNEKELRHISRLG